MVERASHKSSEEGRINNRNGEYFNFKTGVGFFSGEKTNLTTEPLVWLPSETKEVAERIESGESLLLTAHAGRGKSAILYGLRSRCRAEGKPYVFLDGHHNDSETEAITSAIDWAEANDATFFYDSMDYLLGKTRKIRKLKKESHLQRSTDIMSRLLNYIDGGGVLVGTSHDKEWISEFGDPKLTQEDWQELAEKMRSYEVKGRFDSPDELEAFYLKSSLTPDEARYLGHLMENPEFVNHIVNQKGDKFYMEWFADLYYQYRIAKLIVVDPKDHNQRVRSLLPQVLGREIDEQEFWEELAEYVWTEDWETNFYVLLQ